ncbi:MAG: ankyrin repeat domain-containing protein [Treponemataceae bacterium]|nr:ankyrin repeat domain-containing protein [Treponemataceae bacterium]
MNMKRKTIITLPTLALCAVFVLVGCFGKEADKTAALLEAIENNDVAKTRQAIDAGADIHAKVPYGNTTGTVLMKALVCYAPDVARLLIEMGADVNEKDDQGMTALMRADDLPTDITTLLIAHGADVNARCNDGRTALMFAVNHHATEAAGLLIKAGAYVNVQDNDGITALMIAEECGATEMIELLEAARNEANQESTYYRH